MISDCVFCRLRINFLSNRLEVARATAGPIALQHPAGNLDVLLEMRGADPIANAIFSIVSVTVLYSYLAIEAHVNLSLHSVWRNRDAGTYPARKLLEIFGDEDDFGAYRFHRRFRELPTRFKALCDIQGFRRPHDVIPDVWQRFVTLSRQARHFLVHPHPDEVVFQEMMASMLHENEQGIWVRVAEDLLRFLYAEAGAVAPDYVNENQLIRIDGVRVLPTVEEAG